MRYSLSDTEVELTIRVQRPTEEEARACLQKALNEIGGQWAIRGESMVYIPQNGPEDYPTEIEVLCWWPGLEAKLRAETQSTWKRFAQIGDRKNDT